jgi:hypothetical protein
MKRRRMHGKRRSCFAKQKLSPTAAAAKAARDLEYANSPKRKAMRADNQKRRRDAIKNGQDITGMDYDHASKRFETVKENRGNGGKGTKSEGK